MQSKRIVVGTAGHIDHGKTALVKALTGIDADRLEEEKRRGITIDIGFAHLELPDAQRNVVQFGFVDVPGHEKFVRNMLAGVGGIDMVLLAVAADEGIKPQTREHFEICKLLGIEHGITVLTKSDKVSPERLDAARTEVEAFARSSFLDVSRSPIVAVSAKSGTGLDDLRRELLNAAAKMGSRSLEENLRLPIDRVFTMKGFGTVVTGTMVAGRVRTGDEIEILPVGKRARVRGVQVHGVSQNAATAGERTALNLTGVNKDEVERGMTVVAPGVYRTTSLVDARIEFIEGIRPPKAGTRFHLHSYTGETVATMQRLQPGGLARLRLSSPILLLPGDRFILRQFSPVVTLGGGVVLDAVPQRTFSDRFLESVEHGDMGVHFFARIDRRGQNGLLIPDAIAETGWTVDRVEQAASALIAEGKLARAADVLITAEHFQAAMQSALDVAGKFHGEERLADGIPSDQLRRHLRLPPPVFNAVVSRLAASHQVEDAGDRIRLAGRKVTLQDDEAQARQTIENAFASAGLRVPAVNEVLAGLPLDKARATKLVTLLLRERVLVRLGHDLVFHSSALQALRETMLAYKANSATIDVARFKEMTHVSRKYAIPLLEFLDRERITRRQGDVRVIL